MLNGAGRPEQAAAAAAQNPLREYEMLHLASFTSATSSSRLSPEEGLHKLQQMEATTGLWEMQCCLQLTGKYLQITDKRTGDMLEQFPLRQVRQPVASEGGGPRNYDSILLFSIEEPGGAWEMHTFHSPGTPASRVAMEIHQLLHGERLPDFQRGAAASLAPARPAAHNLQPGRNFAPAMESRVAPQQQQHKDSERLVHILNRCFDEIEVFVGRVGEAGRAKNLLESGTTQSRGLLQMRSRMPPTEQFVDILKKMKLVLNLLGRLEGHIHQPNAPELVHFLFTPLAAVVDSLGSVALPARILSPLLTRQAVDLLKHCLTSKESELWYSLGPVWTCHRHRWLEENGQADQIPKYRPCFQDGWEPQLDPELLGQEHSSTTGTANSHAPLFQAPKAVAYTRPPAALPQTQLRQEQPQRQPSPQPQPLPQYQQQPQQQSHPYRATDPQFPPSQLQQQQQLQSSVYEAHRYRKPIDTVIVPDHVAAYDDGGYAVGGGYGYAARENGGGGDGNFADRDDPPAFRHYGSMTVYPSSSTVPLQQTPPPPPPQSQPQLVMSRPHPQQLQQQQQQQQQQQRPISQHQQQQQPGIEALLASQSQEVVRRRQQQQAVAAAAAAAAVARTPSIQEESPYYSKQQMQQPQQQPQPQPQQQPQQQFPAPTSPRLPISAGYASQQYQPAQPQLQESQRQLDERQARLRREAEQRGNRLVQAIHDKTGRNAKELTVQRGEILEVLDGSRNWWQLRNCTGEVGHAPYTILKLL